MKQTHRDDVFCWSVFDTARNLDFHGYAWARGGDNVVIDPVPMSEHDRAHLDSLGGAAWIVVTNRDHLRASTELASAFGARIAGPQAERETLGVACDRWLGDGDELVPGLTVLEMEGSKTPGELALLLEEHTLLTGDLVRGHRGGHLNLLPEAKLTDRAAAVRSVRRALDRAPLEAVLVGDGWPTFRDAHTRLREMLDRESTSLAVHR